MSDTGDTADTIESGATPEGPPIARMGGVLVLVIVAIVVLISSPWKHGMMFAYFGIVPGILAVRISWRAALTSAALTAVAVFVGVWVSGSVPLSIVWMTVVALAVGLSSRIGWAVIGSMIAAQSAIMVVSGHVYPDVAAPFSDPHTAAAGLVVAAFTLGGGLLMTIAAAVFLHGYEQPAEPRLDDGDARWYTATLVVLVFVGTWICRAYFPGTHAWWFLLTVFVVLLPLPEEASHRMHDRAIGTVIGAAVLMVVTAVVGTHQMVFKILAILGVVGVIGTASKSYTINAAFLTVTVLSMASPGAGNAIVLQAERIGLTVLGVLLTWGLMVALKLLRKRLETSATRSASV